MHVSPNEGGDVYVDGTRQTSTTYVHESCGDTVELEAVAEDGYWFAGWEGEVTSDVNPTSCSLDEDCVVTANFIPLTDLYFPHVDASGNWETEICLVNTGPEPVSGEVTAHARGGRIISQQTLILSGHERKTYTVGEDFPEPGNVRYIAFSRDSMNVCGYTKFYERGLYRVAVPAVQEPNAGDIYVPHIDSSSRWWTGLALVNTTGEMKNLTFQFDNGKLKTLDLARWEHKSFTIKHLFGEVSQPDIGSAVIKGGEGVIGLELFSGDQTLSGVLLKDETSDTLFFPHVVSDNHWWTGIAAYNPNWEAAELSITSYTEEGTFLGTRARTLAPRAKFVGHPEDFDLPSGTDWFTITSSLPVNGFELFGAKQTPQLGGYSAVNIQRRDGVFPKIEYEGWTGIAFVNTSGQAATVYLSLYADDGTMISRKEIDLAGHGKVVRHPEEIFGGPFTVGTYLKFESDKDVVGFQLNGSADDMMLDALPGM